MADGLFEQLRGIGETGLQISKVSSHDLAAMVREVQRGEITGGEASAALGLTAQSVTELTAVIAEVTATNLSPQEVTDVFDLVQSQKHYTVKAATKTRLGI
jgi:Glu-tRNA(Gln) amidotransferase subunit E-like FAD-binding protein